MKKGFVVLFTLVFLANSAFAECTYFQQKRMLKNQKMIKNKVINAQVKGKMEAIQELAEADYCNNPETQKKIFLYQQQLIDLKNQKICLKKEYKSSLRKLKGKK